MDKFSTGLLSGAYKKFQNTQRYFENSLLVFGNEDGGQITDKFSRIQVKL